MNELLYVPGSRSPRQSSSGGWQPIRHHVPTNVASRGMQPSVMPSIRRTLPLGETDQEYVPRSPTAHSARSDRDSRRKEAPSVDAAEGSSGLRLSAAGVR